MVDIAAQLSLTASGPAIDPAAILGAETADSLAFGDILAGQVAGSAQAKAVTGAPAAPLPPFPTPTANRQSGGKILPGAAQILPDAAPLGVEAPAVQVLPTIAAIPAVRLVTTPSLTKLVPQPRIAAQPAADPDVETDASAPKQAEASPVHGLLKMLTAALKGQRSAVATAEEAPETAGTPGKAPSDTDTETPERTASDRALALPVLPLVGPVVPASTAAARQTALSQTPRPTFGDVAPTQVATPSLPQPSDAAVREQIQPALVQFLAQPGEVRPAKPLSSQGQAVLAEPVLIQPVQAGPVQAAASAPIVAPVLPVLTVAAAPPQTPAPVVTLVAAPVQPVGQTVAARIKVAAATPADEDGPVAAAGRPAAHRPVADHAVFAAAAPTAESGVAASRVAPAIRAVLAERAAIDPAVALAAPDSQAPLFAATPATGAPIAAVANIGAPTVQMPRQDFAALVDRLVEARNAAVPQSTHALLNHAEFGQVSLDFQQDGGELKVAMSSADPDFARAAQAAQAGQPAERQNFASDTNSRGQSQQQSPAANTSSQSHHEAAGRDAERSDQPGRNGQSRNSRGGGNNSSNPSPQWAGRDQPQARGGIFA